MKQAILRHLFILIISLSSCPGLHAQDPFREFKMTHWDSKKGMPNDNVLSIFQTSDGFIWLSGYFGLARFDGVEFTHFYSKTEPLFTSDGFVSVLAQSSDTALWIATPGSGLLRYKQGKFQAWLTDKANLFLLGVVNEDDIVLAVGNSSQEFIVFNARTKKFSNIPEKERSTWIIKRLLSPTRPSASNNISTGRLGLPLVLNRNGVLDTLGEKNGIPKGIAFGSIVTDTKGRTWMGSDQGLFILDQQKLKPYPGMSTHSLAPTSPSRGLIVEDNDKGIWVGTNDGLAYLPDGATEFSFYPNQGQGAIRNVICMMKDAEGNIWAGSDKGLYKFSRSKVINFSEKDGIVNSRMSGVVELAPDHYLITTRDNSFYTIRNNKVQPYKFRTPGFPAENNEFLHLYKDAQQNIWLGGNRVVAKLNGTLEKIYPVESQARMITTGIDGRIYFAITNRGIAYINEHDTVSYLDIGVNLRSYFLSGLRQRKDGSWILTSYNEGIVIASPGKKPVYYKEIDTVKGVPFFNSYEDAGGTLWFPTGNGIARLNNGKLELIGTKDGMPDASAFEILEDQEGNFWIPGNYGVLKVKKSDLIKRFDDRSYNIQWTLLDEADGLINRQTVGARHSIISSDGKILVTGVGGLIMIDPSKIQANTQKPLLAINQVLVDDQPMDLTLPVAVSPGDHRYVFSYSALSFIAPEKIMIKFRMKGYDRDWIISKGERRAVYTNLPPGDHVFEIMAANSDGVWTDVPKQFSFTVKPFFYQTGWFRILALLALLGLIWLIVRWRTASTRERNIQLEKEVAKRTEELSRQKKELEQKNRELEIESAMERVRSRAMAMHDSGDILATTTISFEELNKLGIHSLRCGIGLLSSNSMEAQVYASATDPNGAFFTLVGTRDMNEHPSLIRQYQTWLKQENSVETMSDEELKSYYNLQFFKSPTTTSIPQNFDNKQYGYYFPFADGLFYSWSDEPYTENEINILNRFKAIVALTFRRFLDLQKAEAQAREAQIELGLERVRARAMAMQKSNELSELVDTVFKELTKLDFALNWCMINIIDESTMSNTVWAANPDINQAPESYHMLFEDYPFHDAMMIGWKERRTKHVYVLEGQEKKVYDEYLFNDTEFRRIPAAAQASSRAMEKYVVSFTFSNFGGLQTVGEVPLSDTNIDILSRFGKVFDLTYTRFNDLQKAEAQAREAQIEASMERVRSRTMAMQKSAELMDVAVLLYNELKSLGITQEFFETGYVEIDEVNKIQTGWTTAPDGSYLTPFNLPLNGEPVLDARYEAWKQRVPVFKQLVSGEALKRTIEFTLPYMGNEEAEEITRNAPDSIIFYCGNFSHGYLSINSDTPLSAEGESLLARFTRVFEMTYNRFLDLKKAESQAREAQIEVALERVRSRTMSMQRSEELGDVASVLFKQMNQLVHNLWTCGFVLCEKDRTEDEWWLSMDGDFTRGFFLPNVGDYAHATLYEGWLKGDPARSVQLDGEALQQHYDWLMEIPVSRAIFEEMDAAGLARPDWQKLHAAYFSKGYLVLITREPCGEEEIFKRFAGVFNLAYTRFKDLQVAEAQALQAGKDLIAIKEAKQKAEAALTELQSTQKQLIQSEKMASLGELTAGIAHEIQNPLNFVNNFAEVNTEMITEGQEAIKSGNWEGAEEILGMLADNNDKILHHGKRADAIVKGMLQHSQKGGVKELTNINALADEYLRLAYHGLKARDRSFNATVKTDFDQSIGKINIIPQDIGRVILNLINNAFYAVDEKKKQIGEGYEPEVTVATRLISDSKNPLIREFANSLIISVRDNGNGIPENIRNKVFQPFFTTKPTGQGTGLGLSLSYDIVKAHGGELKVETKEGEGSEFIIQLPI